MGNAFDTCCKEQGEKLEGPTLFLENQTDGQVSFAITESEATIVWSKGGKKLGAVGISASIDGDASINSQNQEVPVQTETVEPFYSQHLKVASSIVYLTIYTTTNAGHTKHIHRQGMRWDVRNLLILEPAELGGSTLSISGRNIGEKALEKLLEEYGLEYCLPSLLKEQIASVQDISTCETILNDKEKEDLMTTIRLEADSKEIFKKMMKESVDNISRIDELLIHDGNIKLYTPMY